MNHNGPSTPSPAPVRLRRGRIHAIGLVDEAANGWSWLAIQKSLRKNGGPMDAASGAAGAAANSGGVVKALQLPPNTKNVVMALITGAMEGLSTIQTALQDAEETDGATMPSELLGAIEQSGMELVAFAQQHSAQGEGEAVSMSAPEVEIANALVDVAPEIAKSLFGAVAKSAGNGVKKASLKMAPAQLVALLKELVDDFVGRASKWGPMFAGETPAAAGPEAAAPVAAAKKDAAATLKSVRDASAARVAKATNTRGDDEIAAAFEALKALPQMQAALVKLQKSVVGGDYVDPVDEFAPSTDVAPAFAPGENIAASVRAEIRKSKGKSTTRVVDEDDEDI